MKNKFLQNSILVSTLLSISLVIQNCNDPSLPPAPTNDAELITSVKIELTDTLNGQKFNYFFRDLDGTGSNPPSQWDTIILNKNSFYKAQVVFLNESNSNNVINLNLEITAEGANHIVCLLPTLTNLIMTRTDTDGTYPLGLASTWKTGDISTGSIKILLKHQPGLKNGGCDPGETDAEVVFQTKVL